MLFEFCARQGIYRWKALEKLSRIGSSHIDSAWVLMDALLQKSSLAGSCAWIGHRTGRSLVTEPTQKANCSCPSLDELEPIVNRRCHGDDMSMEPSEYQNPLWVQEDNVWSSYIRRSKDRMETTLTTRKRDQPFQTSVS